MDFRLTFFLEKIAKAQKPNIKGVIKMKNQTKLPMLRTENLVVQELPHELLIYDLKKDRALCLNETSRLILDECKGENSIDQAIINLSGKLKNQVSEEMIWMVVEQFKKFDLLKNDYQLPVQTTKLTRRKILQSAAALGLALPVITSLVAPMAVNAQSGTCVMINGGTCSFQPLGFDDCCPGGTCISDIVLGRICVGCTSGGFCSTSNTGNGPFCCPGQTCFPFNGTDGLCVQT
jgi:hypothetical protein